MTGIKTIDGLLVIDAKRSLTLNITKTDVARANVKVPSSCAVARACKRELEIKEVRVHLSRVYIKRNDSNWTRYLTPKNMRDEIIAFDRGGSFEPGLFQLAAPQPSKTLGESHGGDKRKKKSASGKKRRKPTMLSNVRNGPA